MKAKELITNRDGRLSTTGFIQFIGFIVLAITLLYAVYLDRDASSEFYTIFAMYCAGLTVSKGAVTAYRAAHTKEEDK